MNRTKIAQIITRLDRGGSADMAVALCERLDREHFDVTLIAGPSPGAAESHDELARRLGIRVIEYPHLVRPVSPASDLRALLHLRRLLRKLRPDVVHTHTSKAGALGRLAAWRTGIPVVHSPHGHLFYGYYGRLGTKLVVLAERRLAPLADRIAVLTGAEKVEHLERNIGRPEQFVTIPSGIDLERFRPDAEARQHVREKLNLDGFVVAWAGRFAPVKAPEVFVEACAGIAARLPDARFVLAGDGELHDGVRRRAAELGLAERCRFPGHWNDMPGLLNASDVFVSSSRNEGLGLAIVEAMACGVPVVATDVGGVREVLEGGRCGALVPPPAGAASETVSGIAGAVVELAENADRRRELARAGLGRAQNFDLSAVVGRFARLYEELAS